MPYTNYDGQEVPIEEARGLRRKTFKVLVARNDGSFFVARVDAKDEAEAQQLLAADFPGKEFSIE